MRSKMKVAISNRHVHLSEKDFKVLFGEEGELTVKKNMGKNAFAANETVTVKGAKGTMGDLRIIAPLRGETQVELLRGDCRRLAIEAPVCESGQLEEAGAITIIGPVGTIVKEHAAIVAKRHLHVNYALGEEMGLSDGEIVKIKVPGARGLVFDNAVVHLHGGIVNEIHIDVEEANAAGCKNGDILEIVKECINNS